MNKEDYKHLVLSLNTLINTEIDNPKDLEAQYAKYCVMYEFFRMLRGEAFLDQRERDPESQPEYYQMEDALFKRLKELKEKIPATSKRAKFYFDNAISLGLRLGENK